MASFDGYAMFLVVVGCFDYMEERVCVSEWERGVNFKRSGRITERKATLKPLKELHSRKYELLYPIAM